MNGGVLPSFVSTGLAGGHFALQDLIENPIDSIKGLLREEDRDRTRPEFASPFLSLPQPYGPSIQQSMNRLQATVYELLGRSTELSAAAGLPILGLTFAAQALGRSPRFAFALGVAATLVGAAFVYSNEIARAGQTGRTSYSPLHMLGPLAVQLLVAHAGGLVGRGLQAKAGAWFAQKSSNLLEHVVSGAANTGRNRGLFRVVTWSGQYLLPTLANALPMHLLHGLFYGFVRDDWDQLTTVKGNLCGLSAGIFVTAAQGLGIYGMQRFQNHYARGTWRKLILEKSYETPDRILYALKKYPGYAPFSRTGRFMDSVGDARLREQYHKLKPFTELGRVINWTGGTTLGMSALYGVDRAGSVLLSVCGVGEWGQSVWHNLSGVHVDRRPDIHPFTPDIYGLSFVMVELSNLGSYVTTELFNLGLLHGLAPHLDRGFAWAGGQRVKAWISQISTANMRNEETFLKNRFEFKHAVYDRAPHRVKPEWMLTGQETREEKERVFAALWAEQADKVAKGLRDKDASISSQALEAALASKKAEFRATVEHTHIPLLVRVGNHIENAKKAYGPTTMEVLEYTLPSRHLPEALLAGIQARVNRELAEGQRVVLALRGDPLDPPRVVVFERGKDRDTAAKELASEAIAFWGDHRQLVAAELERPERLELRWLNEAVHEMYAGEVMSLAQAADHVIQLYNNHYDAWERAGKPLSNGFVPRRFFDRGKGDKEIDLFPSGTEKRAPYLKRTAVLRMLDRLDRLSKKTIVRLDPKGYCSAYDYWTDTARWRGKFKPNPRAEKILVIGAGDVLPVFSGGITAGMDTGLVPMDTRIVIVSPRQFPVVAELNQTGHRRDKVEKSAPFFPTDSRRPYVIPVWQMPEVIRETKFAFIALAAELGPLDKVIWQRPDVVAALKECPPEHGFVFVNKDMQGISEAISHTRKRMMEEGLTGNEAGDPLYLMPLSGWYPGPNVAAIMNRTNANLPKANLHITGAPRKILERFVSLFGVEKDGNPDRLSNLVMEIEMQACKSLLEGHVQAMRASMAGVGKNAVGQGLVRLMTEILLHIPDKSSFASSGSSLMPSLRQMFDRARALSVATAEELGYLAVQRETDLRGCDYLASRLPRAVIDDVHGVFPSTIERLTSLVIRFDTAVQARDMGTIKTIIQEVRNSTELGTRNGKGAIVRAFVTYVADKFGADADAKRKLVFELYGVNTTDDLELAAFRSEAGYKNAAAFRELVTAGELVPLGARLALMTYPGRDAEGRSSIVETVFKRPDPGMLAVLVHDRPDVIAQLQATYKLEDQAGWQHALDSLLQTPEMMGIMPLRRPMYELLAKKSDQQSTWTEMTTPTYDAFQKVKNTLDDKIRAEKMQPITDAAKHFLGFLVKFNLQAKAGQDPYHPSPVIDEIRRRLVFVNRNAEQAVKAIDSRCQLKDLPTALELGAQVQDIARLFLRRQLNADGVDVFHHSATPGQILSILPRINQKLIDIITFLER